MEKLEELLSQQEEIQAQIEAVKTAKIRQEIEELKAQERALTQQIAAEKIINKQSDAEITKEIDYYKTQIKQLNDLSVSRLNFRLKLENELRSLQKQLTQKQFELSSLLSEV